ncbi:hypothetical protein ACKKBG_A27915 [Auxenochlorella protothecoides x Auxenochlorella symbiontica]
MVLTLVSASLAAEECNSAFFGLPTVSLDDTLYFISARSANIFCRYKGFERGVGKFMARPQEELPTLLHDMDIHIFDIFDMAKCDGRCPMTVFIECVPRGQDSCSADSNLNIGANNTGMNNRGNNNQGWCNLGNNNIGDYNRGSNNTGTKVFCNNLQQASDRCTLDKLRTAETLYL